MAPIFYKEEGQTELRAMWPQARRDKEGSERFYVDLSFLDMMPNSIFIAGVVGLVHADTCQMKLYNGKVASCLSDLGQDGSKERPLIIWGKPLSGTPTSGMQSKVRFNPKVQDKYFPLCTSYYCPQYLFCNACWPNYCTKAMEACRSPGNSFIRVES